MAVIFSGPSHLMAQWIQTNGPPGAEVRCFTSIGDNLFAGTGILGSGVYRSSDHGSSWVPAGLATNDIEALVVIDTVLFAHTQEAGMFRSTDYGNNWIPVNTGLPLDTTICLLAPFDSTLYAGTSVGLYRSLDYGANWTVLNLVTNELVRSSASIGTTLFVGSQDGDIYSTTDGNSWTAVTTDQNHNCLHAHNSDLFAGTNTGVSRSTNFGASWTEFNTGLKSTNVFALQSRSTNLYASTSSGLFRSSDGGTN